MLANLHLPLRNRLCHLSRERADVRTFWAATRRLIDNSNDGKRCTVDIRIMGTHYARAEVFIFWHHYTKIGSRRLAAWYRLISLYVSSNANHWPTC